MARKKIREYDAKRLIVANLPEELVNLKSFLVTPATDWNNIPEWVKLTKLVVKPDQLFGKRKKHGLVLLNASLEEVKSFVNNHMKKEVTIGKATGELTHFLIEPFIAHEQEYYLALKSEREGDVIYFSENGGIDIEDNWDNVKTFKIPTLVNIEDINLEIKNDVIKTFIKLLFQIYVNNQFTYLEINPFTIVKGQIVILDTVAVVDDCGNQQLKFPREFGRNKVLAEKHIKQIDENSGASLKLTILNPQGKIWNILSGGGASIIYLDMIANLGQGTEIANYGESSGNPSMNESYEYAKTIIELMIQNEGKLLFIVGGIANFTDVRATFLGFIKALEKYAEQLKNVKIFIRRGGPHCQEGLHLIKQTGEKLGLQMHVHGPETSMPNIIQIAREFI